LDDRLPLRSAHKIRPNDLVRFVVVFDYVPGAFEVREIKNCHGIRLKTKDKRVKKSFFISSLYFLLFYAATKGNRAMCLARLRAWETKRWCLLQVPVLGEDKILAWGDMNRRRNCVSL
jgi:hypothetical protein